MKNITINAAILAMTFCVSTASQAQWAVIDAAAIKQQIEQVAAWKKQFAQMQNQLQTQKETFQSMNGSRGMAALVNNPSLRSYLPKDYKQILNSGFGNSAQIRADAKKFGIENTKLDARGDAAKAFENSANQAAVNRATAEEGYKQASDRFAGIQQLLDKVNDAPDPKAISDLQARIQAEQVMLQNENIKLQMLSQLAQAQKDLANQQATEIRMKSSKGIVPRF
ncbi:P-type DNA transfer protein VirB5 [Janthinobacterium sp. FW305-128]|uniref:P-type DNA transfer protein VirB5 n=1 Tax=Janthinobacterium sp. FW305-128 TaxID=2775055 RepID=UPI001E407EBE|nr:P-type DNA transfer protein VirB5 [Janthinobacterium sp. FW305-128]MCC7684725.1 P-type DNA transfer protein VirB5 [Janthinobacterium sp. FW305-128]